MITFNDTTPPQQPSSLNENPTFVKTDTYAILGDKQRCQAPSKKRAVMVYSMARSDTVNYYKALYNSGAPVKYSNTLSIHGSAYVITAAVLDYEMTDYVRGSSLLTQLTVTVEEGVVNA